MVHSLPELNYGYDELEPVYSKENLEIHHSKHHMGYVNGLNNAEKKLIEARNNKDYVLIQHWEKQLAFHGAGHILHSMFWENMRPPREDNMPSDDFLEKIESNFGNFESFKAHFMAATNSVEGSGWGVLAMGLDGDLKIFGVENHQKVFIPGYKPILVCDVWEHAYYLKYQNRRAEWVDNFFKIINWVDVESRI